MNRMLVIAHGVFKELIRRKDFYLIFALLLVIMFYCAFVSFGGERGFQRYFKEVVISLAYIFSVIIGVTFASRQIPQEIESKTIYPLLAHPISRGEFVIGKFLGVFFITAASFTLFYAAFIISLLIRRDTYTLPLLLAEGYILHLCLISFFVSLAIFFSLFLSVATNTVVTLILYFGTNWFSTTLPAYVFLPHPELFDIKEKIIHTHDIVPAWAIGFLIMYSLLYTSIFLISTGVVFRRRNL